MMKNGQRMVTLGAASFGLLSLAGLPAMAGSHSWRINEIFSNADGTVQFVELKECCGMNNETFIGDKWVSSLVTKNSFVFPDNLGCCTANKHLLLATAEFAALPGAPSPDYIIPAGFLAIDGDALDYYFYDTFTFGRGELPTDCVTSLHDGGAEANFTGPNSPTNFADETGSIDACACPADLDGSGSVGTSDLLELFAQWGTDGSADLDGSGAVGTADLLILFANWGPCP